jgi:hypothetical protein
MPGTTKKGARTHDEEGQVRPLLRPQGRLQVEAAVPTGETLAASSTGHPDKSACMAELRTSMTYHPGAEIVDVTATDQAE